MIKIYKASQHSKETFKRSIVKTLSYRAFILVLDFATIYIFTGKLEIALGFMIASNTYTTIIYFLHERLWDRIKWGNKIVKHPLSKAGVLK